MSWRHFQLDEFACRCCGANLIDHQFVAELDELRHRVGFALPITSGYRCPEYNSRISSTARTGPHTTGRAADLAIDRARAYEVLRVAMEMKFTGIGVQQKGAGRYLHLDNLPNAQAHPRPTLWSYP